jgi:surface polysaccharide O-acyltransferase-like enzyme
MRHCILTWLVKDTKLRRITGGLVMALKSETGYLNNLRVYACTAVIIFHVFSNIVNSFGKLLTQWEYFCSAVLVNIWLWHVPTFVMISGVIFLNKAKEITIKQLLTKYVSRIIFALFLFGIPFAFMEIFFDAHYQFNIGQVGTAVLNVFQGELWDHMWYLYMISGLYLLLPFLKLFVANANKKTMEYMLVVLFAFTSVIPTVQNIFQIKIGFYLPVNSVFLFYFLLGYYIHYYNVTIKNKILFGMGMIYIGYIVVIQLKTDGINIIGLYGNISPLVVMITLAIFCFVRQNTRNIKLNKIISPYCFGIYLIHQFFLNLFYKFIKFTPEKYPAAIVAITITISTIILSFCFTYCLRKIKIIKNYVL